MLRCPVCQVPYTTSGEQQPRLLVGCGHTFCSKCLESRYVEGEPLRCPQCSLVSDDPHVPNITIMGYVEATATPSPVMHPIPPPQKALCQDCKERQATLICFQCLATGFKFCNTCSTREHNREFGPVKEHTPQPIEKAAKTMPVPTCKQHPDKPCLFFSFKVNKFACEDCREDSDFAQDAYISVDVAISQIRDEVPSLIDVTRERVDRISKTRSELDELLGRVEQEKARALDYVRTEFGRYEAAIRRRHGELLDNIEHEAQFQRKSLLEQQEKLEVAQGNADTAIVRANWLLQMSDYNYLHQADAIISSIKDELNDQEFPIYQTPVTKGSIPIYIPPNFVDGILSLGKVGGGKMPLRLSCSVENGMLVLSWEQSEDEDAKEYEIRYEPAEEEEQDPMSVLSKEYVEHKNRYPCSIPVQSSISRRMIDDLMPGKKYCFRVRALNIAGWGIWSYPKIGSMPNFPLMIGYTGRIVHIEIPFTGLYQITAIGAKAADGDTRKGGRGAIIEAKFYLTKYDKLIILCGGMSKKVHSSSGGAGGTFVALNKRKEILIVAGGGGGTRGHDAEDIDGKDANIESEDGKDGAGQQWAAGGASGGAGKDAWFTGPCWGYGGAGFNTASTSAKSFLHDGEPGEGGGFGGGGGVGHYGGGGGGGYSGGGGGRGGGGGGSYVRDDGMDQKKSIGGLENGSVTIVRVDTD